MLCFTWYMLFIVYIVYCICECGTRPEMSDPCKEWFLNERISRSFEPCSSPLSLSISLLRPTLHIEMLLQNCSRTMQKGVQPATIKMACSPLLASTPTALKQHRDQSIRPVPLSDSDYSDIYQWTVIHIKVTVKVISDTYTLHSVSSVCLVHYQVIISIISEVI